MDNRRARKRARTVSCRGRVCGNERWMETKYSAKEMLCVSQISIVSGLGIGTLEAATHCGTTSQLDSIGFMNTACNSPLPIARTTVSRSDALAARPLQVPQRQMTISV